MLDTVKSLLFLTNDMFMWKRNLYRRIYLYKNRFIQKVLKVGQPADPNSDLGAVVSEEHHA